MNQKLDYMYDYLDYDHDRAKVRGKFLGEMNKKPSLADIGETLDKLHYESKAFNWKHYKLNEHHNVLPKEPFKKYNAEWFKWSGRLLHD